MIIDLFHNKIVKDTATDKFVESFNSVLVPMLEEKYGDSLEAIMMYEDYLADDFLLDGEWHYPLSVKLEGEDAIIVWIKWPVNKKTFRNSVPYSYVGNDTVGFSFAGFVPAEFMDKLQGRAIDYDRKAIKISVEALTDDPLLLVGKYSQTFVDELASQITEDISRTLGVEGFENTTMELQLVFAPGTYLEHTSEKVTYRRLLLTEKSCQARDFWVKWTRINGNGAVRMTEHASRESVQFKIGEDASQKLREKEYRFLAGANPNKYQAALGKKTVTEWRDIIKRALKREELVKVVSETELADHAADVFDRFSAIQSAMAAKATEPAHVPIVEPTPKSNDPYDVVAALSKQLSAPVVETETTTPGADDDIAALVRATLGVSETPAPVATEPEVEEEPEMELEIVELEGDSESREILTPVFEPIEEKTETPAPTDVFAILSEDEALETDEAPEEFSMGEVTFEEYESAITAAKAKEPAPVDEEALLREREAQIRLEQEAEARRNAELEAERLRLEHARLLAENERLLKLAKEEEERRRKEEEERLIAERERQRELELKRAEEEKHRLELERRRLMEEQERARYAETARMAVEEQKRIEAERQIRAEREKQEALAKETERLRREEEERRLEEERRNEQRRREEERLRREEEERKKREAEAARARTTLVEKRVNLIFRSTFDPNIAPRIKEITDDTIRKLDKGDVDMHIRAVPGDINSIILQVKLPSDEMDLLVSIVKAIGNARIGVIKVSIE